MTFRALGMLILVVALVACGGEEEVATSAAEPAPTASTAAPTTVPPTPMAPATESSPTTTAAAEPLEIGLDWVRISRNNAVFEGATLSDVTAFGSGWVVVGVTGDEGALGVWTSDDGVTWAVAEASAFTADTQHLQMVGDSAQCSRTSHLRPKGSSFGPTVATDGELLVLGCGESIWTSTDAATWTRTPLQTPDYFLPFDVPRTEAMTLKWLRILDIAPGPAGWVAVGLGQYGQKSASVSHTATVWRSDDGVSWEVPATNKADFFDHHHWYIAEVDAVVPFGDGWVAAGGIRPSFEDGNIGVWASSDGRGYATLGDQALGTVVEPAHQGIQALAVTPSGLVAVGWESDQSQLAEGAGFLFNEGRAAIWTSPDGMTWTRVDPEATAFTGEGMELATDVTVGGPGLVAVGGGGIDWERWGIVWVSEDGTSWSRVPPDRLDNLQPLAAIDAGPAGLVAVGDGVWISGAFPIPGR